MFGLFLSLTPVFGKKGGHGPGGLGPHDIDPNWSMSSYRFQKIM